MYLIFEEKKKAKEEKKLYSLHLAVRIYVPDILSTIFTFVDISHMSSTVNMKCRRHVIIRNSNLYELCNTESE